MKKIDKKTKWKYGVLAIVFSLAFVAPELFQFIDFGTVEQTQPISWFDPQASDFLYDDSIDETSYPFNAYGKSYIVCNITNTAYANFTLDGTIYNVSYGINYIPIDFGNENKTYTMYLDDASYYDWICVEPVIIDKGFIDINPSTLTDIEFDAGGLVSFFLRWNCTSFNNFTYDELYVEYDGIMINEIRTDWDDKFEIDPVYISVIAFDGSYIQYDIFMNPGSHQFSLKGNATIDYMIVANGDWDEDEFSNVQEIQSSYDQGAVNIFEPFISGYFVKGNGYKYVLDHELEMGVFSFYIPESLGDQFLRIKVLSGSIANITVDEDDVTFGGVSVKTDFYEKTSEMLYYGSVEPGRHAISYSYTEECVIYIKFYLNGVEIPVLEYLSSSDTDCDGLTDGDETKLGTYKTNPDSDGDGLIDGLDSSPLSFLTINNTEINEVVIPDNGSRNTLISMSVARDFLTDYTTDSGYKIWNDMRVLIFPALRIYGNSSILLSDISKTYEKTIKTYNLGSIDPVYSDGVPDIYGNDELEYVFIQPQLSEKILTYTFEYNVSNAAKDDSNLVICFDFVWLVMTSELERSSIIHWYEIDDLITIQSFNSREVDEVNYILGSPDSATENQMFWTLSQNPNIGSFSSFGISDDVVDSGSANYTELFDVLKDLRESNPISTDESGAIDETEVLYLTYKFTDYNVLANITNNIEWTTLSENLEKGCKMEHYISMYISNPTSDEQYINNLQLSALESNMKVLYTKSFGNFTDSNPLEERFDVYDYPIFMNNISFQNGDVLEVVNVDGSGMPLNSIPETIDSTIHDLFKMTSITTVEDKRQTGSENVPSIYFGEDDDDAIKTLSFPRLDVILSDLIFNSYSRSYIDSIWQSIAQLSVRYQNAFYRSWNARIEGFWTDTLPSGFNWYAEDWYFNVYDSFETSQEIRDIRISMYQAFEGQSWLSDRSAYLFTLTDDLGSDFFKFQDVLADVVDWKYSSMMSDLSKKVDSGIVSMEHWMNMKKLAEAWKIQEKETFFEKVRKIQEPTGIFDEAQIKLYFMKELKDEWLLDYYYKLSYAKSSLEKAEVFFARMEDMDAEELAKLRHIPLPDEFDAILRISGQDENYGKSCFGGAENPWEGYTKATLELNHLAEKKRMFDLVELKIEKGIRKAEEKIVRRKLQARVHDSVYSPSRKKFWSISAVTAIMGAILIVSSVFDFIAAYSALEDGNTEEYRYRMFLGSTKLALGITIAVILGAKITLRICGEATKMPLILQKGLVGIVRYAPLLAQVLGLLLDVVMLFDYINMIMDSDLSDADKTGWYVFLGVMFIIGTVIPLVYTIGGIAGATFATTAAATAWIPYFGIIVTIITMLVFMALFPEPDPVDGGVEASNVHIELPMDNIKKHGSLEVGDVIGFNVDIEITGSATHYMHSRVDPGETGYGDWDGNWDEGGYSQYDTDTLIPNQTLSNDMSCLPIGIKSEIAVWTDQKQTIYSEVSNITIPIAILPQDVTSFYNSLVQDPNAEDQKSYNKLINEYELYKSSYEHNKTAEALDKLSNEIEYDFLGETEDEDPTDWYTTETNENEFTVILRPNQLVWNEMWQDSPSSRGIPQCIDEEAFYPDDVSLGDYAYADENDGYMTLGYQDLDDLDIQVPESYKLKSIKVNTYARIINNGIFSPLTVRFYDSGYGWSSEVQHQNTDPNYVWFVDSWNPTDYESTLSDLQVKYWVLWSLYDSNVRIHSSYLEVTYESTLSDPTPGMVSEYKGHNDVMKVTAFGEYARTDFYNTIDRYSGIIDFWLCKDNYSNVELDKFLQIDRFGSILNYDGTSFIRERPILIDEWTHFSVDFDSDSFDLYVNGVQCGDDVSRSGGMVYHTRFEVFNNFEPDDVSKGNISRTYFDAIDYSWDWADWYKWKSFAWDYSPANITYYQGLRNAMTINTSISTYLRENVVETNPSTHIADFDFYFDLVGTENPAIDIELFNIPDGFEISTGHIDQNLEDEVSFDINNTGGLQYAGTYFFEMNVTLNGDSEIIYHEIIPFRIPYVEDLSFEQQNVIYEEDDISSGMYSSKNSFTDDTDYTEPSGWYVVDDSPVTNIEVIPLMDGHSKVVEIYDMGLGVYPYMYDSINDVESGTIEFWHRQDDVDKIFYVSLKNDNEDKIRIEVVNGYYRFNTENVLLISENIWYKHQITFDCSDDIVNWKIDGNSVYFGEFLQSTSVIDELRFRTQAPDWDYIAYIDAVGYSWDSDYLIGDNRYETDTSITGITESQVAKGDLVNVEFRTNTYAEVQMKFVNNDVVQETYTLLPRGNFLSGVQSRGIIISETIIFDEIQFTEFKYNYFDVLQVLITDSLGSIGNLFNPVNITNDGNTPEYVSFDILGVDSEDIYATSSPEIVENIDRGDTIAWTDVEEAIDEDNDWAENSIDISGGSSYVVSVEHVELTLDGVASNYVTLSNDQVLANCVPFISQKMNTYGDDWDENMIDLYFESSPSKRITGQRGEGSGIVILSIYIVEFDGVNVKVQSGTFSTGTSYDNIDITEIVQSKAFPIAYWKITGNDDDWDCAMVTTDFVDDDTVRMERDGTTGTISGHWYVVEAQNSEFSVQKVEMSMTSETSKTASITSIDMSKSFVIGSWENDLSSHSVQYASLSIYLSSSTQVRAIRNAYFYSNSIPTINVFVITFSGEESVQRGSFTFGNSDNIKSTDLGTAINLDNSMIKAGSMYGFMECDGTGSDDPEDSFIQYEFVDSDTVRGERMGSTGEDGVGYWEVVEWVIGGGGSSETESDILRCTDFDFADSIPKDAVITGIVVKIDKHADVATSIKDYSIQLRKPNGDNSSIKKSSEYWDTTDAYEIYGSLNDIWNLDLTYNDIINPDFGVDIIVENLGASSIAYIDHVQVQVYYSKSFVTEILPGETIKMNFTIEVPTESENNLIYRGITYQHLGSNTVYQYIDNFEIDGIYIASPLNSTYNLIGKSCESGTIYPGTYSFTDDEVDSDPVDWIDTSTSPSYAKVVAEVDGHSQVYEICNPSATYARVNHYIADPQTTGTIEFWWKKDGATASCPKFNIYSESASTILSIRMDWYADTGKIEYYNGGWTDTGATYSDDWIHMRIDFDSSSDTFDLIIDGDMCLNDQAYQNGDTDDIERLYFYTYAAANPVKYWIDAFGFSWDPDYNVEDNLDALTGGLQLSVIPEVSLDSMTYSIDGGEEIPFENSEIIPYPEVEGSHTIQVFGLAGEAEYESEIRNFTIRYPIGIISPNETENTIFHEFLEDSDSFGSNDVNTEPDDWTIVDSEEPLYIDSLSDVIGTPSGAISNAEADDENYFSLSAPWNGYSYFGRCTFEFNIDPKYRESLISFRIETTGNNPAISILVNSEQWKYGEPLDENNAFHAGVNEVKIAASDSSISFNILVYFFKIEQKLGTVEIVESMNGINKPVQISNGDYDADFSIERNFPEGYETGNVTFSVLRESITDKNIALITLSGTSGTLVLTLENNDLYNGTYASKDSLAPNILKQDVWQEFVIFFNISEGCQIFVDGINTTMPDEYVTFSTGSPSDIDAFKIETKYTSGESYSFWFDNFLVSEIEGGFMLDVYNRFGFLDNLQYSFDEGVKKSFNDRELFSFPEDGQHNITIYGTDTYGDEYCSEFKIFITESTCDVVTISEGSHAMPSRWDDFTYTYGSNGGIYGTGSMESADGDYTYMNANTAYGSDTYLGYIKPYNSDITANWDEGNAAGSHYDDLNEYTSPDGYYIKETSWEVHDRWNFNSLTIPTGCYVSKLVLQGYVWRQNDDISNYIAIQSNCFGGFQYWSPRQTAAWKTRTITGLNINQASLDAFYLDVHIDENEPPNGWAAIDSVYVQVYYKPIIHRLTATINITIPEADFYELDTLYYKYATGGSQVGNDFDIYNWNTELWIDLEDFATQNWISGSEILTNDYLSNEYNVQVRFTTAISTPDFILALDRMMVSYSTYTKKEL